MPRCEMLAATLFTLLGAAGCDVFKSPAISTPHVFRTPTVIIYDCKEGTGVSPAENPYVWNDKTRMYDKLPYLQFQGNRDRIGGVRVAFNSDAFRGYVRGKDGTVVLAFLCQTDWNLGGEEEEEYFPAFWRIK